MLPFINSLAIERRGGFKHLHRFRRPWQGSFFGGKGGGKTTTSSATAVWLADAGLKVLLVSVTSAFHIDSLMFNSAGPCGSGRRSGLYGLEMDGGQTFQPPAKSRRGRRTTWVRAAWAALVALA